MACEVACSSHGDKPNPAHQVWTSPEIDLEVAACQERDVRGFISVHGAGKITTICHRPGALRAIFGRTEEMPGSPYPAIRGLENPGSRAIRQVCFAGPR